MDVGEEMWLPSHGKRGRGSNASSPGHDSLALAMPPTLLIVAPPFLAALSPVARTQLDSQASVTRTPIWAVRADRCAGSPTPPRAPASRHSAAPHNPTARCVRVAQRHHASPARTPVTAYIARASHTPGRAAPHPTTLAP